ncbi:MAG TPA: fibronectin type III domain-containing protein [Symbiobacteriaceae bacterium]
MANEQVLHGNTLVLVRPVPHAPANLRLARATGDSVTLQWDRAETANRYAVIMVRPALNPPIQTPVFEGAAQASFCTIHNLEPDTEYEFHAQAGNGTGWSPESNHILVRTPARAP